MWFWICKTTNSIMFICIQKMMETSLSFSTYTIRSPASQNFISSTNRSFHANKNMNDTMFLKALTFLLFWKLEFPKVSRWWNSIILKVAKCSFSDASFHSKIICLFCVSLNKNRQLTSSSSSTKYVAQHENWIIGICLISTFEDVNA